MTRQTDPTNHNQWLPLRVSDDISINVRYIISKEAKQRRNEKTKQENLVIAENVAEEESLVPLREASELLVCF